MKITEKARQSASYRSEASDMPAPNVMSADCPSRHILRNLTSRWGLLALLALEGGTQRFSDLRRKIGGVSERMLAQTLQTLESDGMLTRKSYPVVPPHVEYTLTPMGQEATLRIRELADWIEGNLPRILHSPSAPKKHLKTKKGPKAPS